MSADPTKEFWYVVPLLIGGIVGWTSKAIRDRQEIIKIKTEIVKNQVDLIDKISAKEEKLNEVGSEISKNYIALISAIKSDSIIEIQEARNEICSLVCEKYIDHYKYVCELTILRWVAEHDRQLSFVKIEMIPGLERIHKWLTTLNGDDILEKTGQEYMRILPQTLQRFNDIALQVGGGNRKSAVDAVSGTVRKICMIQNRQAQQGDAPERSAPGDL